MKSNDEKTVNYSFNIRQSSNGLQEQKWRVNDSERFLSLQNSLKITTTTILLASFT